MTLFCSTLILANSGLTCDQVVGLSFLFGKRPLTKKDRLIADSFWFESRPPSFWKPLSRNIKSSLIQFLWNQRFRVPFRVPVLFPSAPEPSMNFNNSKLAHFLSFLCVFESKVPRHAFLGATKKKKWSSACTEA